MFNWYLVLDGMKMLLTSEQAAQIVKENRHQYLVVQNNRGIEREYSSFVGSFRRLLNAKIGIN